MTNFTNSEYLDMIYALSKSEGNLVMACDSYNECHYRKTNPNTIIRAQQHLISYGQFRRSRMDTQQDKVAIKTKACKRYRHEGGNGSRMTNDATSSKFPKFMDSVQQPTIDETVKDSSTYECNISFMQEATLPLSIVENESFKQFFKQVLQQYQSCSFMRIKSRILSKCTSLSEKLKETLKHKSNFTITLDTRITSLVGINIHYLDGIVQESATLDVIHLKDYTTDYVEKELRGCLDKWGVTPSQVMAVVANKNEIIDAVQKVFGKGTHIFCFVYVINSIVRKSLEIEGIAGLINRVRSIMVYINKNSEARDEVRKRLEDSGREEECQRELIIGDSTRWNTVLYMSDNFIKLSPTLSDILSARSGAPPNLTTIELETLKEVVTVLRLHEKALRNEFPSDEYVPISQVIPIINCLEELLERKQLKSAIGSNFVQFIRSEMKKEFGAREQHFLLAFATILDPRFKGFYFSDPTRKITVDWVKEMVSKPTTVERCVTEDSNTATGSVGDLWELHRKLVGNQTTNSSNLENEMSAYLSNGVADLVENPFLAWNKLQASYPNLFNLAQIFLSPVATSAPVERLLPKADVTLTDWSKAFPTDVLNKLIFLNNLPDKYW